MAETYPPKFNSNMQHPREYNLDKLKMPDEDISQGTYFSINFPPDSNNFGTNSTLSLGKHYFKMHFNPQPLGLPRLKAGSKISFEFKDAKDISGKRRVIFSDVTPLKGSSSYFIGYVWLKEDPIRTYQSLVGGMGTLTIVGEVETTNTRWKNKHNIRTTISFDIDLSTVNNNTSPILLQETSSSIETGIFISESIESYKNIPSQSFAHISASMLKTYGGEISQTKLSFVLSSSFETGRENYGLNPRNAIYTDLPAHIMGTGTTVNYENDIDSTYSEGINPESEIWKVAIPPGLTGIPAGPLPDDEYSKVKFKLTLTNSENSIAQDLYGKNSTGLSIMYPSGSNSWLEFTGSSAVITGPKNLMSGELIFGTSIENGVKVDFKPIGEGARGTAGSPTIEFTPIADGVSSLPFTFDNKGGFTTGATTNGIYAPNSANSSDASAIIASTNSEISASDNAAIIGNNGSTIEYSQQSVIIGGQGNKILHFRLHNSGQFGWTNSIFGGQYNQISSSHQDTGFLHNWGNTIVGGSLNKIKSPNQQEFNTIVGGLLNTIKDSGNKYNSIVGGQVNTIENGITASVIIGGEGNTIQHGSSVIIGMSDKTSTAINTTYVQNLDVSGTGSFGRLETTVVSASVIYSSGSNIFGDSATEDTHTFNGGIVAGHITASGNISSSGNLEINHITASGNISMSGDLYIEGGKKIFFSGEEDVNTFIYESGGNLNMSADGHLRIFPDNDFIIHSGSTRYATFDGETQGLQLGSATATPPKTLTVEGDISASGGYFGQPYAYVEAAGESGVETSEFTFLKDNSRGANSISGGMTHKDGGYSCSYAGIYELSGNVVVEPDNILSRWQMRIYKNNSLTYQTTAIRSHLGTSLPAGQGFTFVTNCSAGDALEVKINPTVEGCNLQPSSSFSIKKIS